MGKNRYEGASDSSQCGHPNQQAHMHDMGNGKQKMIVTCRDCGMEWS